MKEEKLKEAFAKQLYLWLHHTCATKWESSKTPEVVRFGYRKRAEVLLNMVK